MKKRKSVKSKEKIIGSIISLVVLLIIGLFNIDDKEINLLFNNENNLNESTTEVSNSENSVSSDLKVYFIDVGQADSILVTNKEEAMLIDAGNNEDGDDVVNFVKEKGIKKLNYVIGTHPHEDHIGGLDNVINSDLEIQNIFMTKIQTNTKTFEDVLDAISNKGLTITAPKKGDVFKIGEANCEVMTDSILNEKNLNLSSIIIRLQFGNNSILFMGDSENENEEIRDWPKTDVLKVGHHGSLTSTSERFLSQVQPSCAIIMVGKNNTYNLPKQEVIERLNNIGAKTYRTDEQGTIEMTSDGKELHINIQKR